MSFNALQAKTWRFNSIGDTDVLTLETLPVALPAAGEVLIQMKTIGLNRADVMFRRGTYIQKAVFPSRLGYENAGLMSIAPLSELKVDEWDRMIDINIKGVLYGIAATLPVFQKQNFGHFINLASVAGIKVFSPGGTVYSGTKFAVRAISEGLRHEVGGTIRTTTIEPGAVESELKFGSSHKESSEFVTDFYKQAIPADSVARAIAYAIEQPADVDINEIVLRPTSQEF
ncbi:SDR family NAD(P)-dependent oxidoreductase [Acinetobacter johnsonii]|uniref:SDR family NAD(P)-dependent oxidoreductase n=1 Tax=Acinetobacter johnsonii TaxID=40214 RepID=A0AA43BML9_ACIJO|nr:SDR family NAD(P)-dependent oxidoreductase [Acinetobacter johnsonii]MDH2173606.1 SDR family NAD(P)-dependent oxidoreductase [Acinetobacter johnsonii]MDH2177162.1 SDR family NAD(P)-dependent oxidoreductase [Acinetobacter johnsonii]